MKGVELLECGLERLVLPRRPSCAVHVPLAQHSKEAEIRVLSSASLFLMKLVAQSVTLGGDPPELYHAQRRPGRPLAVHGPQAVLMLPAGIRVF